MKHVKDCLRAREDGQKRFSPLRSHCELGASLFMCGKDLKTTF